MAGPYRAVFGPLWLRGHEEAARRRRRRQSWRLDSRGLGALKDKVVVLLRGTEKRAAWLRCGVRHRRPAFPLRAGRLSCASRCR
jgi:hypothetical protein